MRREITNGKTYLQVRRNVAERMYNEGIEIFIIPCRCRFDFGGPWVQPFGINNKQSDGYPIEDDSGFEARVTSYELYNCVPELGRYAIFFYCDEYLLIDESNRYVQNYFKIGVPSVLFARQLFDAKKFSKISALETKELIEREFRISIQIKLAPYINQ